MLGVFTRGGPNEKISIPIQKKPRAGRQGERKLATTKVIQRKVSMRAFSEAKTQRRANDQGEERFSWGQKMKEARTSMYSVRKKGPDH